ncbi:OmpA family protein [compost metagenome]
MGGSDEDLDRVPFEPGSSVLGDAARQRLDTLAAALRQRPQLRLEVEGASAVSADGPLLAERRLQREYRQLWYNSLQRRGQPVPATPDDLEIDEDLGDSLLQAIYRSQLGQPPASWAELADEQVHDNMRQALLARWSDNHTALRRLAQERAASIKAYLVDQGGLEDKRIYLLDSALVTAGTTGSVETPLHLDSQ